MQVNKAQAIEELQPRGGTEVKADRKFMVGGGVLEFRQHYKLLTAGHLVLASVAYKP